MTNFVNYYTTHNYTFFENNNKLLDHIKTIDPCRALIYAVIETKQPQVKEILTFILWERLDWLYQDFHLTETAPI
ncbi:hypothetical protein BVY05_20775 [Pectobacterium odoriferum]|nr:hypothetical protein BVY05_20775 [Pectobacterium odoriferum]